MNGRQVNYRGELRGLMLPVMVVLDEAQANEDLAGCASGPIAYFAGGAAHARDNRRRLAGRFRRQTAHHRAVGNGRTVLVAYRPPTCQTRGVIANC